MNAKKKGGSFERKVCKALSLWVTDGQLTDCFWRSAMSGGRATVHQRKGTKIRQSGDVCAVSPEGQSLTDRWFIECKHVRALRLSSFLLTNTGPLAQFWRVACRQALDHEKLPMVIARENGNPVMVIVPSGWFNAVVKARTPEYDILLFDDLVKTRYLGEAAHESANDTAGITPTRSRRSRRGAK